MEISLQQLFDWTTQAVDAGVQAYIRRTEPESDRIKQSDAKRYIARQGFQPVMLHKWVKAGLIEGEKTGGGQNSAVWYSLADIKNLINSIKLKEICNNQNN